jgi:hypothetical protein
MGLALKALIEKKNKSPSRLSARSAQRLLSLGYSSDSSRTNISWGKKQAILSRRMVWKNWERSRFLHLNPSIHARLLTGRVRSRLIVSFFEQPTPFPDIPFLRCTPQQSACQFPPNEHSWPVSRTSQVPDFSIFVFMFNDYREWGKNWHRCTQYTCYPCHTEDEWPLQEVRASPARPPTRYRLLVSGRASVCAWKPYTFHTQTIINHIF